MSGHVLIRESLLSTCCCTTELESTINAFREILRQSWIRRALRTLTTSHPAALLPSLSLSDATSLRDSEWEGRERAYHEAALGDVNALVRKYNTLAPYAVRRPYYTLRAEVDRVYQECGADILQGIAERVAGTSGLRAGGSTAEDADEAGGPSVELGPPLRIRDVIRHWLAKLMGRWR